MDDQIIFLKKEVLHFLKNNPKLVKSVLLFNNNLFFLVDEDNLEFSNIIKSKFKNASVISLDFLIDNLYEGNQLYIRVVEESEVIFDLGLIKSLKKLIEKGKIRPSKEAIYHSFLNSIKLKEESEKLGKTIISKMFWALYYLLQAYFMSEGKYLTPEEILKALKFYSETDKLDKKVYLLYEALYNLYYNLHKYKFEEFEFLFKQFDSLYNHLKEIVELKCKAHLNQKNKQF